jgi:hypothetical protein
MQTSCATAVAVALAVACYAGERCQPVECMRRVNVAVPVEKVFADPKDVPGLWHSQYSGLSGRNLYLFSDGTYIYTEWADVLPETIYDRGRWRFHDALLRFVGDQKVTWATSSDRLWLIDRRLLSMRPELQHDKWFLLGLDDTMDVVASEYITADRLESWSFTRAQRWKVGEEGRVQARLLKEAWRPGAFRK